MPRDHEVIRPPRFTLPPAARPQTNAAVMSLDGRWRFRWSRDGERVADPMHDGRDWAWIQVPGHWQMQGYGAPAYTNNAYPFPIDAPHVPDVNPLGEYRRPIHLPASWPEGGRTVLRFEGVDSWYQVWLNGTLVGEATGSRLASEFDVTDALRSGHNLLAVAVRQWSFSSYLEDQDQWWLSGIFRSVTLRHRPDGGVDDVFVHAGWDHRTKTGAFRVDVETASAATVSVPALGVQTRPGEQVEISGVSPWSAESPELYDVLVTTASESVALRVGFRSVTTEGGVLLLNGAPLVFRGVNRHDFDPRRGRAVTRAAMEQDVLLMKRHHINAVRTSHYPPDDHFLDLCDRYGLYVMDECDLETHGFHESDWLGNPVDDPAWTDVLVDRMQRMVERDKNHPSVVMWSLGNEAGWGSGIRAMADWTRHRDSSRPLHYEPDEDAHVVDVYSRMYPRTGELDLFGRRAESRLDDPAQDARRRALPMVMCEYAHAMGNGPGGLAEYEAIVDRHPRLAGGFVWEWYDHAIAVDHDGGVVYRYGGDFGEELHDGSFVVDGLLLPDRRASPGLHELAAVFAPVRLRAEGGSFTVENRRAHLDTSDTDLVWRVERDGHEVAAGRIACPLLMPGQTQRIHVDHSVTPSAGGEWWLTVEAVARLETAWAPAGHVLGRAQQPLRPAPPRRKHAGAVPPRTLPDGALRVGGVELGRDGTLRRLFEHEVHRAGISMWRAPTENDLEVGDEARPRATVWKEQGLDRLQRRLVEFEVSKTGIRVRSRWAAASRRAAFDVTESWSASSGRARLELDVARIGDADEPAPRLDLVIALACPEPGSVPVEWFGLGPGENYPDSREASWVGLHRATVREMQTHYVVPQENGCRMQTRWAHLGLDQPLRVSSAEPATFTVRPWSTDALTAARHADELREERVVWMHWGAGIDGLGSAACGAAPSPQATFRFRTARLELEFEPVGT